MARAALGARVMQDVGGTIIYGCSLCPYNFGTLHNLEVHLAENHAPTAPQRDYGCLCAMVPEPEEHCAHCDEQALEHEAQERAERAYDDFVDEPTVKIPTVTDHSFVATMRGCGRIDPTTGEVCGKSAAEHSLADQLGIDVVRCPGCNGRFPPNATVRFSDGGKQDRRCRSCAGFKVEDKDAITVLVWRLTEGMISQDDYDDQVGELLGG